ncbi:MAG TPA: hypothetical protein VMU93_12390, partial [Caulobacteraceae bacterium]|nr:hypothetical protein [Caulobacteraceae bacterium]
MLDQGPAALAGGRRDGERAAGFARGPGETQIETDRRLLTRKVARLKKDLADVRRTRTLG